jgi:hypothetical protein
VPNVVNVSNRKGILTGIWFHIMKKKLDFEILNVTSQLTELHCCICASIYFYINLKNRTIRAAPWQNQLVRLRPAWIQTSLSIRAGWPGSMLFAISFSTCYRICKPILFTSHNFVHCYIIIKSKYTIVYCMSGGFCMYTGRVADMVWLNPPYMYNMVMWLYCEMIYLIYDR